MAELRGGQYLWNAQSISSGAKSPLASIGAGPYVTIYIKNPDAAIDATFAVEVSATASPKAGRNALDSTADGGLDWFPLQTDDGHVVSIAVTHGTNVAVDLSPFGPQFIRLRRTDANGAITCTALVSSYGPS